LLYNTSGTEIGKIEEYINIPNNPLFKLFIDGEEVLIPAREEWIDEVDEIAKRIVMDLPDGLVTE
jgi:ribosomal 30S subunit maturation factor RimM